MGTIHLLLQLRNNKAKDVCLDQGPLENHTAILYPCHGWGPQVGSHVRPEVKSTAPGLMGLLEMSLTHCSTSCDFFLKNVDVSLAVSLKKAVYCEG